MSQIFTIGKDANNSICLTENSIEAIHCQIIIKEGTMKIAENNPRCKVFVNDMRTQRATISLADKVQLGSGFVLEWERYFEIENQLPTSVKKIKEVNDFREEFMLLKEVYDTYMSKTRALTKKEKNISGFSAMIPYAGRLLANFYTEEVADFTQIKQDLSDEFQKNYRCPKCKLRFGTTSWEALKDDGKHSCGAKWTTE